MTAIPPITMPGASIRWKAFVRSARALRIFWLGRFAMGLVETADADPTRSCQLVVATASFVFGGGPVVHFAEQVHQRQGPLDGRGGIGPCLATFFALPPLNGPPSPHHATHVFRIHRDSIYLAGFGRADWLLPRSPWPYSGTFA